MILNRLHIAFVICFMMLMVLSATDANAQQKNFKYKFISKLISADSTGTAISRAHVINTTQKYGTVCDDYGAFTLTANIGDSIVFSAIGYETLTIVANDTMYTNTCIVKLNPIAYELSEVNIGILSTYERFRQAILSRKPETNNFEIEPISKYEIYTPALPNQGGLNAPVMFGPNNVSLSTDLLYNLFSKEGKQRRYVDRVIDGTAKHVVTGEKFSGSLVNQLTGLENDELVKFMSYCNFSRKYLLHASQLEINRAIARMYREYVKAKSTLAP